MRLLHTPTNLVAGIDNLSLDKRKFDPSRDDIEQICRFFCLGKLKHYENEKGVIVSHSNFFIFLATTRGQYALKFYPPSTAKTIVIEYALNRILIDHHFLTPLMYPGVNGQPFYSSNNRLATCYSYINGQPAWKHIKQKNVLGKINATMLSLKNLLTTIRGRVPLAKQASCAATIKTLARDSRILAPYDQKEMIDVSLQDACRTYQHRQRLFTRQWLHNNTTLTNFIVCVKSIYTLDLSHIREDYALSDLASLVISCLLFNIDPKTIKFIVEDYFARHKLEPQHFPVLNTLVKIGLIREYLKNVQREKSVECSTYPPDLTYTYKSHLSKRKKSITEVLKELNDSPGLITRAYCMVD